MEEAGLFFYSSEAAASVIFRLVTKQEFENVGVIIPGTISAPSQVATINLLTGEALIVTMSELAAKTSIRAVGFRSLVKAHDARVNRTYEDNLRLQAQQLLLSADGKAPEDAEAEHSGGSRTAASRAATQGSYTSDAATLLLGGKTRMTERLKAFVSQLELTPISGAICIRVLEELGQLESSPSGIGIYATLFSSWFAGGEIADLLTTLVAGKGERFLPLAYRAMGKESQAPGIPELKLVQELVTKAATDSDVSLRLAFNRPGVLKKQGQSPGKIMEWVSNVVRLLSLPELPVIDLAPMLNWTELQTPKHFERSCVITTKPTSKLQLCGDIVIDRCGFGLGWATAQQRDELEASLSQSSLPEDQRLRTILARYQTS